MSMSLASQVWKYKLDKTTMPILMALCDSAEDDGSSCYPSARYVAWKTGSGVSTVYRVLTQLEQRGVLLEVGRRGDTPEYQIYLDKLELKRPFQRVRRGRPGRPSAEKSSQSENDLSERENIPAERKDSRSDKKILAARNHFSEREKISQSENEQRRLEVVENQAGSGSVSKRDVSDPILYTHPNDPSIKIQDASQKIDEEKPEAPENTLAPADGIWIQAQSQLRQAVPAAQYSTYLTGAKLYTDATDPHRFVLIMPTRYTAEQVRSRFNTQVVAALRTVARGPFAGLDVRHREARVAV